MFLVWRCLGRRATPGLGFGPRTPYPCPCLKIEYFPTQITPSKRTSSLQPILRWKTLLLLCQTNVSETLTLTAKQITITEPPYLRNQSTLIAKLGVTTASRQIFKTD